MFDDQQPSAGEPPKNLPTEPVDMFAGVEKGNGEENVSPPNALKAGVLKKKESVSVPVPPSEKKSSPIFEPAAQVMPKTEVPPVRRSPSIIKIIIGILGVFAVVAIGYAAKVGYDRYKASVESEKVVSNEKPSEKKSENTPVQTTTTTLENQSPAILFEDKDSDNDLLTDSEEKQLGTNVDKPDTDGDGLSDGDETRVWRTDPFKKDTDGDTFGDGSEIMNGYNPLGSGKLSSPQMPIVRFVTTTGGTSSSPYSYINYVIKVESK